MTQESRNLERITLLGVKQVLTTSDVALLTGLSASTVYKLTSAKKIPHYKSQGGKINYFDKCEITKWMLECQVKTSEQISAEAVNYIVLGRKN